MPLHLNVDDLLAYTDWERDQWQAWFREQGADALRLGTGPHGDGRFGAVGEVVRHIFSAEKRYVERIAGRPLSDTGSIPTGDVGALFALGQQSRSELRALIAALPPDRWDVPEDHTILKYQLRLTPRKIVVHVVMHEIRHWAQIATMLRWQGHTTAFQDFLFSPVLAGEPSGPSAA